MNFVSQQHHVQEGPWVGLAVSICTPLPGGCLSSHLDSWAEDGRYQVCSVIIIVSLIAITGVIMNLDCWWCVNINFNILTRRERLCLYYQLIVGEVDGCDEKATPTPRVYLLLELMQVSCLVILFHSLFQWFFSLKLHKNSHYFLGRFPLSLSRKVFTLFHMFSDVMLRFVRVWRCLWAGTHKHFKGPRLHQQGQGY